MKKSFLSNLSLNKKIMLLYIPVISFGILFCSYVLTYIVREKTMKQFCETKLDLIKNISDKMGYINENIINISNAYLMNDEIQKFFRDGSSEMSYEQLNRYQRLNTLVVDTTNIFFNISYRTTMISLDGNTYLSNSPLFDKMENERRIEKYQEDWDKEIFQLIWTNPINKNGKQIVSAIRYVLDTNTGETLGMLIFDFDESVFQKLYMKYVNPDEEVFLMKIDGNILSSSTGVNGENRKKESWFQEIEGYKEGYFYSQEDDALYVFVKNVEAGMYVVEKIPHSQLIMPYRSIVEYIPFIVLVLLGCAMLVSAGISHYIAKPIQRLTQAIRENYRDEKIDSSVRTEAWERDEIAYLNDEYRKMMDRFDKMVAQIYYEQEQKRAYEIEALQCQINPHFLYNTLLSVRYMNVIEQRDEIDKVLVALIQILSDYFKDTEKEHTVAKEVEFLKNYTYIQQIRYGQNFEVEFLCEEEAKYCLIPKMILQPLVENSIFHGVSSYESGGLIKIEIRETQKVLMIKIEDNGVGFDENETKKKKKGHHGIGIKNVRERLELLYGSEFSLIVSSEPGEKTEINLRIPTKGGTENEDNDCRRRKTNSSVV